VKEVKGGWGQKNKEGRKEGRDRARVEEMIGERGECVGAGCVDCPP